jgi:tetratricopeptide (TPR) repeat protein
MVLGLLLAPVAAHAQGGAEQAKALAAQGTARYQVGLFDEALRLYEAAYKVHPVPALIFNIAQCQRQLKNYDKAAFLYRSFLRALPDAPNRAQVEEIVREMDRLAGEQRQAGIAPPGQNLSVEGGAVPVPVPVARPAAVVSASTDEPESRPWYKKWWVWTIVGVVVAGGAVGGAVAATRGGSAPVPMGSLGNMSFGFGGQK